PSTHPTQTYTLSLHDALPISVDLCVWDRGWAFREHIGDVIEAHGCLTGIEEGEEVHVRHVVVPGQGDVTRVTPDADVRHPLVERDRKSTRLNSSHVKNLVCRL